jgi:hypothetical protein
MYVCRDRESPARLLRRQMSSELQQGQIEDKKIANCEPCRFPPDPSECLFFGGDQWRVRRKTTRDNLIGVAMRGSHPAPALLIRNLRLEMDAR